MNHKVDFQNQPIKLELKTFERVGPFFHRGVLEIFLMLDGEAEVECRGKRASICSGEYIIINAGSLHEITANGKSNRACGISVYIDLLAFTADFPYISGLRFMFEARRDSEKDRLHYDMLRNYILRLTVAELHMTPAKAAISRDIAKSLVAFLCRFTHDSAYLRMPFAEFREQDAERLLAITRYISGNYKVRELGIADIAAEIALSPSRTAHFWGEFINIPLQRAVNMNRIEEAVRLLTDTKLSIYEIAEQCGFSDEKYLYRWFKQLYGFTPAEYRRRHLAEHTNESHYRYNLLDISSNFEIVGLACHAFFVMPADFTFLNPICGPDKRAQEREILTLYDVLIRGEVQSISDPEAFPIMILRFALSKGLCRNETGYEFNWEYLYIFLHWHKRQGVPFGLLVEYDLITEATWEQLLDEFWSALPDDIADFTQKNGRLIVTAKKNTNYVKIAEFHQKMRSKLKIETWLSALVL